MDIVIIGAGSLGSLFGVKFALSGKKVLVFCSEKHKQTYLKKKLIFHNLQGNKTKIKNITLASKKTLIERNEYFLMISTKSYSLKRVCKEYNEIIKKSKIVFLLQNGIGNEEIFKKYHPEKDIFRIISSNGAFLNSDGNLFHTGEGSTIICGFSKKNENNQKQMIEKLFEKTDLDIEFSSNSLESIWKKAFINIGINAFGALARLNNGDLIKISEIKEIIPKTVIEAKQIAELKKVKLDRTVNYVDTVFEVIKNTKDNKNSMLQDILKGAKTEIEFLNGKIVEWAKELGIHTPYNEMIVALIKGLEYSVKKQKND